MKQYAQAIGNPLGRYYSLARFDMVMPGWWDCVIRDPFGNESKITWVSDDEWESMERRAMVVIMRQQRDYAAKISGRPAQSHWHRLAATGSHNNNLERLKRRNRARCDEWLRSKGKRV